MLITATQKNTRQPARKVRLVANTVKKLPLVQAIEQLGVIDRHASLVVLKVVRQAIANAQHNHQATLDQLKLVSIMVDDGPQFRRFRAVSRGRGHGIVKRTCHVSVTLEILGQESAIKTSGTKAKADGEAAAISKVAPSKVKSSDTKKSDQKKAPAIEASQSASATAAKKPLADRPTTRVAKPRQAAGAKRVVTSRTTNK
jgi:large subunit ribosomal protein L22